MIKDIIDLVLPLSINGTYQCNKPFSSIIIPEGHFCIGNYMFGNYIDEKSICVANIVGHGAGGFFEDPEWYNLVIQVVLNDEMLWTSEHGNIPVCISEEKYFQEMTRTDFKGLEIDDFKEILQFYDVVNGWISECRKNNQ